jgi:uncharacterized membrane protein
MSSAAGRTKAAKRRARAVTLGVTAAVIGYAAATHWVVTSGHADMLGIGPALAPVLVGSVWLAARTRNSPWAKLLAVATALGLAVLATRRATPIVSFLYPLPSVFIYSCLVWIFARTLGRGREALVTRLARQVHGTLPDDITAYTRQVSWAWCVFFRYGTDIGVVVCICFVGCPVVVRQCAQTAADIRDVPRRVRLPSAAFTATSRTPGCWLPCGPSANSGAVPHRPVAIVRQPRAVRSVESARRFSRQHRHVNYSFSGPQ